MEHDSKNFLSCDWGTSSFRLRRVLDGHVAQEISEPTGAKVIYERALAQAATTESARAPFFEEFLSRKLSEIGADSPHLPLVISGMASSTIGWKELPYANLPLLLDGSTVRVEKIDWPAHPRTYLISGVASNRDVMRGEETQIIGLLHDRSLNQFRDNSVLILPGTHSKHVTIQNNAVTDFRTYVTGELFDVLGKHSVLSASVDPSLGVKDMNAFRSGVLRAREESLSASLFSVRAQSVLEKRSREFGSSFLSGLLIGAELSDLVQANPPRLLLAASGELNRLYSEALTTLSWPESRSLRLPDDALKSATLAGHSAILSKFA